MGKEQDFLNKAIYDKDEKTLDDVEKPKKIVYKKKDLGYEENILDKIFKKKKKVKRTVKKEKKETTLGKVSKNPLNIFKKDKKITYFKKL